MGFLNASFIAGAAERASEIMQEERENAQKVVDQSMRIWSELGIPAYKERKKKTNDLSMKFDTLSRMGYNTDQIELATRDGSLDKLIEYSAKAQSGAFGKDFNFVPAEVVRLGPDYKDSGRTKADYLESVMGKVERGMDLSDAIEDAGGKKVGFLGQNLSGIMKKRAEAFQTGLGVDMQTLAALARDDVTMTESPVTGTISMYDPTVEAQAEARLQGGAAGQPGVLATRNFLSSEIAGRVGGKGVGQTPDGRILYQHEAADIQNKINIIVGEEVAKRKQNRFSADDLLGIETTVLTRLKEEHNINSAAGSGNNNITLETDASDPITMEDDAISRITKMPQDAGRQKSDIINDAVDKIYKYYLDKEGEAVARAKAAEARNRMIKSITG
jgi:hypothetical protein